MLLTIKTIHTPATDLGFLLHKHPDHVHTREFPFGTATVFYPQAGADACTAGCFSTSIQSAWCGAEAEKAALRISRHRAS